MVGFLILSALRGDQLCEVCRLKNLIFLNPEKPQSFQSNPFTIHHSLFTIHPSPFTILAMDETQLDLDDWIKQ